MLSVEFATQKIKLKHSLGHNWQIIHFDGIVVLSWQFVNSSVSENYHSCFKLAICQQQHFRKLSLKLLTQWSPSNVLLTLSHFKQVNLISLKSTENHFLMFWGGIEVNQFIQIWSLKTGSQVSFCMQKCKKQSPGCVM